VTSGSSSASLAYDANGNTLTDENGNSYQWDALNRLTRITYPSGASSLFAYDGLSRRVQIVEKDGSGTVTSTKNYLWIGSEMAEERDASNAVTKRFFPQGEQQITSGTATPFYYTRDHLRSVRELVDGSGNILTRYGYDAYGKTITTYVSGTHDATFLYAGMQVHLTSGLYLSKGQRIYDPATGKWNSTDPSGENGGINLYEYCEDSPIDFADPFGLEKVAFTVISVIRPPDFEAGVKTIHSVTVDTDTGKIISGFNWVGDSALTIPPFAPRYFHGKGKFTQSASGGKGCITVNMTGDAHSSLPPMYFMHIQYDFTIEYNSNTGSLKVSGSHTAYPSFEVYKNSTKVYDFQQTTINQLQLSPNPF